MLFGDCVERLKELPDNCIDSIVTDPPYNLSDTSKRDGYCLREVVSQADLPEDYQRYFQAVQRGDFSVPAFFGSDLGGVDRAVGVDTRIGVPEGSVDFDDVAGPVESRRSLHTVPAIL